MIGCNAEGRPVALRDALASPTHQGVLDEAERAVVLRWVDAGMPSVRPGVHPARFADPRSPDGHVKALRGRRHAGLFDAGDRDACARCHEGAGARPEGVTFAAPGATACTTCHAEPGGVLACATCHGSPGRPYPPRDPCFFPAADGAGGGAGAGARDPHAAHAGPSRSRAQGIDCAACHPRPETGAFAGPHGDGHVEVWFDPAVAGRDAKLDAPTKRCTGTCHDRGGARPGPTWSAPAAAAPLACNDCHGAPPPSHFPGPCNGCHREADATGTSLTSPKLHVNGNVDLGDGSGRCGACHGEGDSPWPKTGAHAAHATPAASRPVACETCHPTHVMGDGHPTRAGEPVVRLAGLATKGGSPATWDPATRSCAATYCHDRGSGAVRAPRWSDGAAARACNACHTSPPPPPHSQATTCGASGCHDPRAEVHVDGVVDRR